MKKRIILISTVAVVITCIIAALTVGAIKLIHLSRLPNMEEGVVYNDHQYTFMTSKQYGYTLTIDDIQTKEAIGRFDDAIIYTIENDPDAFYLYPKVFLPHLPYNLLCRIDGLPFPDDIGNIDYIDIYVKDVEHGDDEAAYRKVNVTDEMENSIIDAFREHNILISDWNKKVGSEIGVVTIHFCQPNGLYYRTSIIRYGDKYGLLSNDDKTLIVVSDFLSCDKGS